MNKGLIREHAPMFLWLLEDDENRTCMVRCENGWHEENIAFFEKETGHIVLDIVKNDEYATERMAHAEGKQIQHNHPSEGWCDSTPQWSDKPENYRIKPDSSGWV